MSKDITGADVSKSLDKELRALAYDDNGQVIEGGNPQIKQMQDQLRAMGFDPGVTDGFATLRANKNLTESDISRLSNTQSAMSDFIDTYISPEKRNNMTRDQLFAEINSAYELEQKGLLQTLDEQANVLIPTPEPINVLPIENPLDNPMVVEPPAEQRGMIPPVTSGEIIESYEAGFLDGINIAAPPGTPVIAVESGSVAAITADRNGSPIIVLRHEDSLLSVYANVGNVDVKLRDQVKKGDFIAEVGNAGHLHFETREGFDPVDPTIHIPALKTLPRQESFNDMVDKPEVKISDVQPSAMTQAPVQMAEMLMTPDAAPIITTATSGNLISNIIRTVVELLTPSAAYAATLPEEYTSPSLIPSVASADTNITTNTANPLSFAETIMPTTSSASSWVPPALPEQLEDAPDTKWSLSAGVLAERAASHVLKTSGYGDAYKYMRTQIDEGNYGPAFYAAKEVLEPVAGSTYLDFQDDVLDINGTKMSIEDATAKYGEMSALLWQIDDTLLSNRLPLSAGTPENGVSINMDLSPTDTITPDLISNLNVPEAFRTALMPPIGIEPYIQESEIAANFTRSPFSMSA